MIEWGNLVWLHHGRCLLIRTKAARLLPGTGRGKRLCGVALRIRPGGEDPTGRIELGAGHRGELRSVSGVTRRGADRNAESGRPTSPTEH